MALSVFDDKTQEPQWDELEETLGRTKTHWKNLTAHIAAEFAPCDMTWNFGGLKWGWVLRLKQKKRTVLNMAPCRKHFLVGFVLGEKELAAIKMAN